MNELSLFTGAGGGVLGTSLLGFKHVGYVEWDDHCQKVIAQRIKDGCINNAPIFTDIRAFIDSGCAKLYQGVAQVVSAGFPCQPHSQAGNRLAEADERDRWPETIEVVRQVRPDFCLLENVPGLLTNGYAGRVFGELAESGYDANWCVLGGYTTSSCCESERLWIVAAKTDSAMLESLDFFETKFACQKEPCRRQYTRAISKMLRQDDYTRVKRNSDAVAEGMERLKAIGNGQVPGVVATAWRLLAPYS